MFYSITLWPALCNNKFSDILLKRDENWYNNTNKVGLVFH